MESKSNVKVKLNETFQSYIKHSWKNQCCPVCEGPWVADAVVVHNSGININAEFAFDGAPRLWAKYKELIQSFITVSAACDRCGYRIFVDPSKIPGAMEIVDEYLKEPFTKARNRNRGHY